MIISNDLIRDTLLCIAKHIEPLTSNDRYQMFYTPKIVWKQIYEDDMMIYKYDMDDVKYCIRLLLENRIISGVRIPDKGRYINCIEIHDITLQGYDFLKAIKNDTVWERAKASAKKLSDIPFQTLVAVAGNIATQIALQGANLVT